MKRACLTEGCKGHPRHGVVLVLRPPVGVEGQDPERREAVNALACNPCRDRLKPEDIITPEWWARLVETFIQKGLYPPQRELTTLEFVKV